MIRSSLLLAALAVVSVVSGNLAAQTQMPIPPHSTTFSGNVRGYWFTTPVDITIVGVRVPTDATTGPQSVEVVIFDPGVTPPSYSAVTNSFTSAFRQIGVATTTMMATNIQVPAGRSVGILGWRDTTNSYAAAGQYNTTIAGNTVTLTRMGMQFNLNTQPAIDLWQEITGNISRTELYYTAGGDPEINVIRPAGTSIASGATDNVGNLTTGVASQVSWTVENQGSTNNLNVSGISAAPSGVGNCNVTGAPTLNPASPVAPGANASFTVDITPTSVGAFEFTITISNDDANEGTYTIIVQGTGTTPPEIDIQRPAATSIADGGTDTVSGTAASVATNLTYTVANQGGADLLLSGGTPVTVSTLNNCTASVTSQPAGTVAGSATTTFVVSVTPGTAGAWSFTLQAASNDANENPYDINVSGTASAAPQPEIDLQRPAGTSLADGGTDTVWGTVAATPLNVTWVIENQGSAALGLTGATPVTVTPVSNCTVSVTTQPAATVSIGATTNFIVSVTASAAGAWSFTMAIANDDADENPYNLTVSGSAQATAAPEIDVLRGAVSIADGGTDTMTNTGTAPFNVTYTIFNQGAQALNLTGTAGSEVVVSGTSNCSVVVTQPAATSLASGVGTTFMLAITPSAAGGFSFDLSIANDDANENPYNFAFSGNTTTGGGTSLGIGGGGGGGGGGCTAATNTGWPLLVLLATLAGLFAMLRLRRAR